jgi:hypothetical protein
MRNLVFNSWSNVRLRKCVNYVQQRVMEIRQHGLTGQQLAQQVGVPQPMSALNPQLAAPGQAAGMPYTPMNPYTKTPLLSRRRRFPTFY